MPAVESFSRAGGLRTSTKWRLSATFLTNCTPPFWSYFNEFTQPSDRPTRCGSWRHLLATTCIAVQYDEAHFRIRWAAEILLKPLPSSNLDNPAAKSRLLWSNDLLRLWPQESKQPSSLQQTRQGWREDNGSCAWLNACHPERRKLVHVRTSSFWHRHGRRSARFTRRVKQSKIEKRVEWSYPAFACHCEAGILQERHHIIRAECLPKQTRPRNLVGNRRGAVQVS